MKKTIKSFQQAKGKEKLSMVTAYDYTMAKLADESGIDAVLVGDSLGMVMLGYENTLEVTVEDMVHHSRAVSRALEQAFLVCDMPFMSYHTGVQDAVRNAGTLITKGRALAVKLEGGKAFCAEIAAMVRASIPVMGHLGLTPQSIHAFGGFRVQGKSVEAAQKLLDDARALQDAGVFSIVLEGIPQGLGGKITEILEIPTIGIGAGPDCDGQVLVAQDLLAMTNRQPKFVRPFGAVGKAMLEAFQSYNRAVKEGSFPDLEHCYTIENEAELLERIR